MTTGVCDPVEVQRFVDRYSDLHPLVQRPYAGLLTIYSNDPVTYDVNGPETEYNLRYATHPQTNLSEANAADLLCALFDPELTLRLVTDMVGQKRGHDLYLVSNDEIVRSVSVKLASISPDPAQRSFTVSLHVKRELLKKDQSDWVVFVDNINKLAIIVELSVAQAAMSQSFAKNNGSDRILVFFDFLGKKRAELVYSLDTKRCVDQEAH